MTGMKSVSSPWDNSSNDAPVIYVFFFHAVGSIVAILSCAVELPPALRRRTNRMILETTNNIQPGVQIHEAVFKNKFEIH